MRRQSISTRNQIEGENTCNTQQSSRIVEFYNGRSVFITGASGFIGKLLLEKLLRTCTGLKRIFVLLRPRRNKTAAERFEELFNSVIFDKIREKKCTENNNANAFDDFVKEKIHLLEGDLTEPLLGLSEDQVKLVAAEVSVVLHSAAIVSFDGRVRRSVRTNLTGTYNVLELSCRLDRLVSFVHVSTCYSNCNQQQVDEHIYPVEMEPRKVVDLAECLDDQLMDSLRQHLVGQHPNPYTYTKQMAEYLCGQYGLNKRLPVLICRPSIVISTLEEPYAGFTDNKNAMNGIFWGISRGLLRTARGFGSSLADQVPSDMVVNSIIALGWFAELYHRVGSNLELEKAPVNSVGTLESKMAEYYADRKTKLTKKMAFDDNLRLLKERDLIKIPVCHVSSGVENPVSYHEMFDYVATGAKRYPSINLFREPRCRLVPNRLLHKLYQFWLHTLTGCLLNWLAFGLMNPQWRAPGSEVPGRKPTRSLRVDWSREFQRVDRFMGVLTYFLSNTWQFNPETRQKLIRDFMNSEDNRLFYCDTSNIDWEKFGDKIAFGMRKYVLGEREETIREAKANYRRIYWRNTGIQFVLISAAFHIIYMLILF